ncbi:MAG: ABC transporter ATP-binding protein, partial [Clostridia bacterium]|nr:ABC transporter ATP-binding protein [Clostridia bacterium]
MLRLSNVTKNYEVAGAEIEVLKGLNVSFRKSEFVSILGPSGCGKTTTLNIVGGLDKYTSGDLFISGKSTKNFTDRDWDNYRNQRIGFVFQSYNLIPHQTVLGNVELSLTISGVSKEERVKRARAALDKVGLKGEYYKRPNQLSGGQCQRVAIARALVNEPDILLADEPTGALDSKTSVQIMELIKEISKDKLVIMVTHNAEIAEQYSNRIIRLVDGEITEDTNPFSEEDEIKECQENKVKVEGKKRKAKKHKAKMSWWTAFKLSLRNLFTKKGRTILTSFAGSIGIIGISLILAVSQGTTAYINNVQESTLSSYPVTLEQTSVDLTSLMESFMGAGEGGEAHDDEAIYKDPIISELVEALSKVETSENDLKGFKAYLEKELEDENSELNKAVSGVSYSYNVALDIYTKNIDGKIVKSDTEELMTEMVTEYMMGVVSGGTSNIGSSNGDSEASSSGFGGMMMSSRGMWEELLSAKDGGVINPLIKEQYDLIYGDWPTEYNEVVLVVNDKNEIDDLTLYALGLLSESEIDAIIDAAIEGKTLEQKEQKWTYKEICEREYATILPHNFYTKVDGGYIDNRDMGDLFDLNYLYENNSVKLKVKGIIRENKNSDNHMLKGSIAYTYKFTEYIINEAENSDIVKEQMKNPNVDVFTGKPFKSSSGTLTDEEKKTALLKYIEELSVDKKADAYVAIKSIIPEDLLNSGVKQMMAMYPTRDAQQKFIIQMFTMGNFDSQMSATDVEKYLGKMSDEQIENLTKTTCESIVAMQYAGKTAGALKAQFTSDQLAGMLDAEKETYTLEQYALYYDTITEFSKSTYEANLKELGYMDLDSPSAINIYASSFENKDVIVAAIDKYNEGKDETEHIKYTDFMGIMMSSITTIIDAITYVLIAFVAISLV